jgi:signal transduction histidine kinase
MSVRRRSTVRLRLTVLYAAAFFMAGAVLVALTYFYLRQSLDRSPGSGVQAVAQQFLGERGLRNFPLVNELLSAVVSQAAQERRDTLQGMLEWSLVSLGVVGIVSSGCGWLLAGRALQPLNNITETVRRVADRSLHERIGLDGPNDEIKDLADTFDAMLERLDRAFDSQRRFVANASHELRTPLAINRTLIEVALDDPDVPDSTHQLGTTLLAVNHRNERLIDGLLILASSEKQLDTLTRVDLSQIAERAIMIAGDAAARAGIDMRSQLTPTGVAGDSALLERLAQNLVDNAIRYNLADRGWVSVTVTSDAGTAWLTVENTGPVIAPHEVDGLFDPFRRLASTDRIAEPGHTTGSRGAGLGLSIVRSVATAHGGHARAAARHDGGLTVTVEVPTGQ